MGKEPDGLKQRIRELESMLVEKQEFYRELEKSEARYRRLVEGLEDEYIIFSHDMEGRYLYVSPSVKNILGVEPEEFRGKGWDELFDIPQASLEAGLESDRICAEGQTPAPFELTVILKDGREIIFETKERPLFDSEGNVVANEGIAKDITARKKIENELREALAEIKTLQGIIPICANCKKIRDDKGYWQQLEKYIMQRSDASFSHGICPECVKVLYPGVKLSTPVRK